jgi:hypothetical protein
MYPFMRIVQLFCLNLKIHLRNNSSMTSQSEEFFICLSWEISIIRQARCSNHYICYNATLYFNSIY